VRKEKRRIQRRFSELPMKFYGAKARIELGTPTFSVLEPVISSYDAGSEPVDKLRICYKIGSRIQHHQRRAKMYPGDETAGHATYGRSSRKIG